MTNRSIDSLTERAVVVPLRFGLSIPVALIDPRLACLLWFAPPFVQSLAARRYRARIPDA